MTVAHYKATLPPLMSHHEHHAYIMEHVKKTNDDGIYEVVKPMMVFKKINTFSSDYWNRRKVIVSMLIPIGALIHYRKHYSKTDIHSRKLRASQAFVVRMFDIEKKVDVQKGTAGYSDDSDKKYHYHLNKVQKPRHGFSMSDIICAGGIHFFAQARDALSWS